MGLQVPFSLANWLLPFKHLSIIQCLALLDDFSAGTVRMVIDRGIALHRGPLLRAAVR